ncbi:hypothetical protein [Geotalea toluenoxydans]|uniref:hypothetical protein n=1 Tax=Geotalea toluenoxydans TaxID=421624 RepID=UPI0006CF956B|nr:hypothetical protein [Geotalea toluenoxydans]
MAEDKSNITTITNSGTIGAIAVGTGAIAVEAGGSVSVTAALDAQFAALEKLVEQHQSAAGLKALVEEAIRLSKSGNPAASKPIWDEIALYGGAIGSLVGGIAGTLALL